MPIYEFKCSKCDTFFEVIVMGKEDDKTVGCPECKSSEFERVVSTTNYRLGASGGGAQNKVHTQERNCSSGTCKTYTVPGETP